jgi:hypothetical protein
MLGVLALLSLALPTAHIGQARRAGATSAPTPAVSPTPPDELTGKINPAVTPDDLATTVCHPGWASGVRPPPSVTSRVRHAMAADEHVDARAVVLDHIVPLEAGGNPGSATDWRNFMLQPRADGHRKDLVENLAHRDICSGRVPLRVAQLAMARDWTRYKQEVGDR